MSSSYRLFLLLFVLLVLQILAASMNSVSKSRLPQHRVEAGQRRVEQQYSNQILMRPAVYRPRAVASPQVLQA